MLLAGDIGGTKTRLAVYQVGGERGDGSAASGSHPLGDRSNGISRGSRRAASGADRDRRGPRSSQDALVWRHRRTTVFTMRAEGYLCRRYNAMRLLAARLG
jgi:hypothetical protein